MLRLVPVVQETEDQVIGVLVLVPVLERVDLENGVWQEVRDAKRDLGASTPVEPLSVDLDLDVVACGELSTGDVEGAQVRAKAVLRPEDPPRSDLVRVTEELDEDRYPVHLPLPAEAGLLLREACVSEVLLERLVCLDVVVDDGETDNEVDVGRADVRCFPLGQFADQVPGCQSADEIDLVGPGADVAEDGDENAFAALRRLARIVACLLHHQPMISRRRCSACSRPRLGSRRAS